MLHDGFYILSTQPLITSFIGSYPFLRGVRVQNKKFDHQPLPKWFRPKHVLEDLTWWICLKLMIKTPVAFLIFNRPDTTKKVFDAIRQAKRLFEKLGML
ncbi:MAG: hypothetical protein ACR9NN_14980 [Nostochopsis sp.]